MTNSLPGSSRPANTPKLSVVIPVFNERPYVEEILRRVASIQPKSNRFGFEPEITARVAKGKWRVYEIPISYSGRTHEEGKKIIWRDGMQALWFILRYRFFD